MVDDSQYNNIAANNKFNDYPNNEMGKQAGDQKDGAGGRERAEAIRLRQASLLLFYSRYRSYKVLEP